MVHWILCDTIDHFFSVCAHHDTIYTLECHESKMQRVAESRYKFTCSDVDEYVADDMQKHETESAPCLWITYKHITQSTNPIIECFVRKSASSGAANICAEEFDCFTINIQPKLPKFQVFEEDYLLADHDSPSHLE